MMKQFLRTTLCLFVLTACHDDYDGTIKPVLKDKTIEYAFYAGTDYLAPSQQNLKISIYLATGTVPPGGQYLTTWDTLISDVPAKDLMILDEYKKSVTIKDVDINSDQVWYARNIQYDLNGYQTFNGKTSYMSKQIDLHKEKVYF